MDSIEFKLKVELLFAPEGQKVRAYLFRISYRLEHTRQPYIKFMEFQLFYPYFLINSEGSQLMVLISQPLWSIASRGQNKLITILILSVSTFQQPHRDVSTS